MKMILVLVVLSSLNATALPVWPGDGGKICLDTPKPAKYSGQDYKIAVGGNKNPEKALGKLEDRPTKYNGPLTAEINDQSSLPLPAGKGVYISGLDPEKKHKLKIKDEKGKTVEVIQFSFDKVDDPRIRISQGSFYHKNMQINPPPRKCPWVQASAD